MNILSAASLNVNISFLPFKIAAIARANVGMNWGGTDCTDFVWGVTNLAGRKFFDLHDHTVGDNPLHIEDTLYVVPHRPGVLHGRADWPADGWEHIPLLSATGAQLKNQLLQVLREGDVVRGYKSPAENDGHSFIVSQRVVSATGAITIKVVDNVDGLADGIGHIGEHDLHAYVAANLANHSEIFISRLAGNWSLTGTSANNLLLGGNGRDNLRGLAGRDDLKGRNGNDVLNGGSGADSLTGGGQADVFVFSKVAELTPSAPDRIIDFSHLQGDRINLRWIDADVSAVGDQEFNFIGASQFSGSPGQLRYSGGTVLADVDGDKLPDLRISIANFAALSAADFLP